MNLHGKSTVKATVSVNLGNGIILHEQDSCTKGFNVVPPQRQEHGRACGTHHDLIEFENKQLWEQVAAQILNIIGLKLRL